MSDTLYVKRYMNRTEQIPEGGNLRETPLDLCLCINQKVSLVSDLNSGQDQQR